jgi:hypothetical protein
MNIRYLLIRFELEQMERYLELLQSSISQRFSELEVDYKNQMWIGLSKEEAIRLEDHYTDQLFEVARDFPRGLLSSFIVAWYSFVEQELLDICEQLS